MRALVGAHSLEEVQRIFIQSKKTTPSRKRNFVDVELKCRNSNDYCTCSSLLIQFVKPNPEIGARHTVAAQVFRAVAVQQKLQKEDVTFAQDALPAHCPAPAHRHDKVFARSLFTCLVACRGIRYACMSEYIMTVREHILYSKRTHSI